MGLTRDFIMAYHQDYTVSEMAKELRITRHGIETMVARMGMRIRDNRVVRMLPEKPAEHNPDVDIYDSLSDHGRLVFEQTALIQFINERSSGILVDIAKRRVRDLEIIINT
jgi:predicted DNA-binding protein YlxM (UPF0122 family)